MTTENLPDGVYFNIPEAQYHSLKRLSASGIKNVLVSVPTFWAKSWMNPDKEEADENTKAKILGSAYHVAIFEPETLNARYAGRPDTDSIKGILRTDTEVKAKLKEIGEPMTKAGENALDRAWRLVDTGYDDQKIAAIIKGEFESELGQRQAIDGTYWDQIQRDIARIKANPEIYELVTGGASEVTILWTDPATGIPMKARIDKLKKDLFVDLKSFANMNGKPVNQAISDQVQYYRYYLSMRVYQIAIRMIKEQDLQAMDAVSDDEKPCGDLMEAKDHQRLELVESLRAKNSWHQPWLFFQEKNGIPNLLARKLVLQRNPDGVDDQAIGAEDHDIKQADSVLTRKADLEIQRALQLVTQAMQVYGSGGEPWYPFDMIGEIGDEDFRDWFLDSVPA